MQMRSIVAGLVVAVILASCSDAAEPTDSTPPEIDSAELMALALTELVTEYHTFGEGPPPFSEYLIETNTVPIDWIADEESTTSPTTRPLTEDERMAIEEAIAEFGPVTWIDDPAEWRTDIEPVRENSVILGVDVPVVDHVGALVPVSLWCGTECGTWFTFRLEHNDGVWEVTGIEGPVTIS